MSTLTIGLHDGCPVVRFGLKGPRWLVVEMRPAAAAQQARYFLRRLGRPDTLEVALLHGGGFACSCHEKKLLTGCRHVKALRLLRQWWGLVKPSGPPALDATGEWPVPAVAVALPKVPAVVRVLGTDC